MAQLVAKVPAFNLTPQDLDNPLFRWREQREWSALYLQGLLSPEVKNKAVEPMMLTLVGDAPNAAQWILEVLRYRQRRNHATYLSQASPNPAHSNGNVKSH